MKNNGTLLAQNLKKLRKMNNYSMSAVAHKLELSSHGVYANWEYGRNEPNVATLVSIAKLYNISIDELVGYKTETEARSKLADTHFEVIDMIKALDNEDCKLVEEVLRRFRGYSFSRNLNL
ncbi:DNA-binding helix-turn-helix protein [Gemella bergeri ATCC 700627]|uniref:DNA-binding helix-turn-helix protein n=1 Tax=Gemella bergeri ATCC 700627 TaxID=1321820 RepID=U2QMM4_9BACL|nr:MULTISPECIES: helix-turn-helix transcriptional regulator [Gemella]AME09700.1 transcriptional regulator [Gemella sp. oral taxon 928]AXI27302.1 XRE family transcriptional regulator [Gemella sp. ND 6198]ERK57766.1 DNA-binding helix-turn-helix protein [Gemella bergeri ATCC 700627]